MKKESVCAVVVTYNRKELLMECLEGVLKQTRRVDGIYIVDNASIDETPKLLKENGFIKELPPKKLNEPWEKEFKKENIPVYYIRMKKNVGGAGGFYEGMKRAYERGFDWLWLMDDDVEPMKDALENQLEFSKISQCIHPRKIFVDGTPFLWNSYFCENVGLIYQREEKFFNGFVCVNLGCFEGMLIAREIVSQIGYPKKEFFLGADDAYYGYLASKYTNVLYIEKALFTKKIKKDSTKKGDLTLYLMNRNFTYFIVKVAKRKTFAFLYRLYVAFIQMIRYRSVWSVRGFIDGLLGKWEIPKKIIR